MTDHHDDDSAVWIRTAEAAALLNVDPGTLRRWAREGKGPRYKRIGETGYHVAYDKASVVEYNEKFGPFLRRRPRARKEAS